MGPVAPVLLEVPSAPVGPVCPTDPVSTSHVLFRYIKNDPFCIPVILTCIFEINPALKVGSLLSLVIVSSILCSLALDILNVDIFFFIY